MHYTTLGKTQLRVSVAGLGCGGNSRIGLGNGLSEAQCVALVQEALDLGVNLLDTAAAYGTESIVGKAIKGRARDGIVISTKSHVSADGNPLAGAQVVANLDTSLRQLDSEYVDLFHLHGLSPKAYGHAMTEIVPALLRQKEKGKLRHLAVSETGPRDPEHKMLERAAEERRVGGRHVGLPHVAPERASTGAGTHACERHRHSVHVCRTQHLQQARTAANHR